MTSSDSAHRSAGSLRRRALVLAGVSGAVSLAGCGSLFGGDGGPQDRSFDVEVTLTGGELQGTVAGAGDVEDVVQVNVGDTVTFTFTNGTDEGIGVHDHATDAEVVLEPGGEETMEFEVRESMVGRQEIEAWLLEEGVEDADSHGADATTIVIVEARPRGS